MQKIGKQCTTYWDAQWKLTSRYQLYTRKFDNYSKSFICTTPMTNCQQF